jgi:hypothetical protein
MLACFACSVCKLFFANQEMKNEIAFLDSNCVTLRVDVGTWTDVHADVCAAGQLLLAYKVVYTYVLPTLFVGVSGKWR